MKDFLQNNDAFDRIYPERFRKVSFTHFTPVEEAILAAKYLVSGSQIRVLDIGSGIGKFCLIGATVTEGHFTGIELREEYHRQAQATLETFPNDRVSFLHGNIEQLGFEDYDAFYLFNPFFEQVIEDEAQDFWKIERSKDNYFRYAAYVNHELERKPLGTRVATFYGFGSEIPESYRPVGEEVMPKLVFWEKVGYPK